MSLLALPKDYAERVYAGVLGKIIGVYLGRPFEGWTYEHIMEELGEITQYVHERRGVPLVVTDDDISGTFTFVRALADYGYDRNVTAAQIGQTWLNYIIEGRTILWWGGLGNSTEHTAYLRLKRGIKAPKSGSMALNGKVVSEQIGSQIFIDGWAMVSPGDPEQAAEFARRAASVSHDGEAIYGAQVLAAMEAQAFVERDINALLDLGTSFIPRDSVIYRVIHDIRDWHESEPDWRKTREKIVERYGYDRYGGNCHMVPNHALIILALLYGEDDFHRSLMIANTAGWDTDCNSGNVGCLLGIKNGLQGLEGGPDWRGPVADRLYLPTADGGRAITDAVTETYHLVRAGHALRGIPFEAPRQGARFHFSLPGSVQGFHVDAAEAESAARVHLDNALYQGQEHERSLEIRYERLGAGQQARVATPTFVPPDAITMPGYTLLASPTLYAGQTVQARLGADHSNGAAVTVRLSLQYYGKDDHLVTVKGPEQDLAAGEEQILTWRIPDTTGQPIATIGIELSAEKEVSGRVYLASLGWAGAPNITLTRPLDGGIMWRRAWVNAVDQFEGRSPEPYRLVQNDGRGMISQGTREWTDYVVSAAITPHAVQAAGLGARVQGLQRYYALMLSETGKVYLLKVLDGETVLGEAPLQWELDRTYSVRIRVVKEHLQAWVDGTLLFDVEDEGTPLSSGGVALLCQEGRMECGGVTVQPAG
ncbi:ADP-ribosylglycohydrolase family protein [Dictyobacter aurantiacus]|nr:ADP-ribosylglycohydrolase family protein [Dictyobacter aurantiacus]